MTITGLPFLTDVDPLISGEGILDPLGLSTIGDRLADSVLPGLRARMARPRFLTAMAVSAAVCDGLPDVGKDGVTSPQIIFEWLLVEGFARAATDQDTVNTPGTHKAQDVRQSGEPMRPSAYLRSPTVFGFHGIYKPLAIHVGIVDDELRLADEGYALLRIWEREQGLDGFLERALGDSPGRDVKQNLRSAVQEALDAGHTTRKASWKGWELFARHLVPGNTGKLEASKLFGLMLSAQEECRAEAFRLIRSAPASESKQTEWDLVRQSVKPGATEGLCLKLEAIEAFEALGTGVEAAFERLLHMSSQLRDRAMSAKDFSDADEATKLAAAIPRSVDRTERALADYPLPLQKEFSVLAKAFGSIGTPGDLYRALLEHHSRVQEAKKPSGKRKWFEGSADEGVYVRPNYRVEKLGDRPKWGRPYRFTTVRSFCEDLAHGQA